MILQIIERRLFPNKVQNQHNAMHPESKLYSILTPAPMPKKRDLEIDITKGLLTIGMVFAHVINILYYDQSDNLLRTFKYFFIDLGSFSGFLFCFGYASWNAYYQKGIIPWYKVLKTALKCYIAFVISGIAWQMTVESKDAGFDTFIQIVLVRHLPPYSEFLITFSAVTILGALLYRFITIATQHWAYLLLSFIFFLAFTLIPHNPEQDALVSAFIGGGSYISFPLLQYFPVYLLGVFAARNPQWHTRRSYIIASCNGLGLLSAFLLLKLPLNEHPPSTDWIVGSIGMVLLYRHLANLISLKGPKVLKQVLNLIGQNVLVYLLLSNLALMFAIALGLRYKLNEYQLLIFFFLLLLVILFLQHISTDVHRANQYLEDTN